MFQPSKGVKKSDKFLSKSIGIYPNVNRVFYFSAQNSMSTIKALAYTIFEISFAQSYVSTVKEGIAPNYTSARKGKKGIQVGYFVSNSLMQSQNPSMHATLVMGHQ